jgi:hypothetical protein
VLSRPLSSLLFISDGFLPSTLFVVVVVIEEVAIEQEKKQSAKANSSIYLAYFDHVQVARFGRLEQQLLVSLSFAVDV